LVLAGSQYNKIFQQHWNQQLMQKFQTNKLEYWLPTNSILIPKWILSKTRSTSICINFLVPQSPERCMTIDEKILDQDWQYPSMCWPATIIEGQEYLLLILCRSNQLMMISPMTPNSKCTSNNNCQQRNLRMLKKYQKINNILAYEVWYIGRLVGISSPYRVKNPCCFGCSLKETY
jgi:hypothetical protein